MNMRTKWITNKQGQRYLIDADDPYMERCLSAHGYQIKNWEFAQFYAAPQGTAIDVGASIGMNTINYAEYFDRVISMEPDPAQYECLQATVTANGCHTVETIPAAAGARAEVLNLVIYHTGRFGNCLLPQGYHTKTRDQLPVRVYPIDQLGATDVTFIKIDVEGSEMRVLEGAAATIGRDQPVIQIEVKPQLLKRHGTLPHDIWAWFADRAYTAKHWAGAVTEPLFVDTGRFTARSKYGLEYRIEFADITKNLVDFWFVPSHLA